MQPPSVFMDAKAGEGTLPKDHEDQMDLGIKIIRQAHQTRVHTMQQEINSLKITCEEQRNSLTSVQKQKSVLEVELVETHQRSQQLAEENKELFKTVNSLRKQISRLENLKAVISSSLQDDAEKEAEGGDIKALTREDYLNAATPLTAAYATEGRHQRPRAITGPGMNAVRQSPYESMQPMQPMQPAAQLQPYQSSQYMQQQPTPGGYAPPLSPVASQGGIAPPENVIDGKKFFRQARGKLSYQAFNEFLQSIKRLNAQQQTREETLRDAQRIFGSMTDLYDEFQLLLNKQTAM